MKPIFLFGFLFSFLSAGAQDLATPQSDGGSLSAERLRKTVQSVGEKAFHATSKLDRATEKYLTKLQRQEEKLRRKLWKKDSSLAKELFSGVEEKYAASKAAPERVSRLSSAYSGHLDSLTTALNFLKSAGLPNTPQLNDALGRFSSLQGSLNQSERVRRFIAERRALLKERLQRLGMVEQLKGFQKQAYYYAAQVRELKAVWENPEKLERRLMEEVVKLPIFKAFFARNSQLGSLFALPGGGNSSGAASLQGLQTRASVQAALTQRFGSGPQVQQALQQNMQAAQAQLASLKSKIAQYGTGSFGNSGGDIEMPEGFKPNSQKTKTFLQRLEYGANLQSQRARTYFPATSDLGLSLGYKLNDKSAIGLGASYKLGLGNGWNNLRLTNQGLGLRSYVDYKLKGTLFISGGYEQNYRTVFNSIDQLRDYSAWQTSGLLGLSKKYKVSGKVKGEMKVLWDFMSYQQVPRTQAVLFRVGYSLK